MNSKRRRILVFGYFGYRNNQLDGQTVKTRAVYELVKERYDGKVTFADSQEFRHNIKSIVSLFKNISKCTTLLWLPAHNNLKFLFPFVWLGSKIFGYDVIYIVIGGWLSKFLEKLPFHRNKLRTIKAILLENKLAKEELSSQYGFENLDIIPNFRETSPKPGPSAVNGTLRLVFMARINKMKGLDTIAEVASRIAAERYDITIDFYGPIHEADGEYFRHELIERFDFINYRGVLQPSDIYSTLLTYDVMLFPTHYYTEGFPGSIMDAYRSAVPVIATGWKHAREFVVDGESGFIVDFEHPADGMFEAIEGLYNDRDLLAHMKDNAYHESLKYSPNRTWNILNKYLNN